MVEKHRDFARLPHWVIRSGRWAGLSPSEKAVYIALLSHADYDTMKCYPTRKTISKESGVYYRSVSAATDKLDELGLIQKLTVNVTPTQRKTVYQVVVRQPDTQAENQTPPRVQNTPHPGCETQPTQAVKLGHRSRALEVETPKENQGDPSSKGGQVSFNCAHLGNGGWGKVRRSFLSAAEEGEAPLWDKVQSQVASYHADRLHRELPCTLQGCLSLPIEKIQASFGRVSVQHPMAHLAASLKAALPVEEDRAQEARARQATSRRSEGLTAMGDFVGSELQSLGAAA